MISCPRCNMVVEPGNRLILPDGTEVHRDKSRCFGLGNLLPAQAAEYHRLYTRTGMDRVAAYRRATGRSWEGSIPPMAEPARFAAEFAR